MEEQVSRLVEKIWAKFEETPKSKRYMVAVSGIPGSGKTTLAAVVTKRLNARHAAKNPACISTPVAAFVPMDGYHLTRAQLSAMPDPEHAHSRRGAAFTFDGDSFLQLVRELRKPLAPESKTLFAPSFDHAIKDPIADDISITPTMRVLLFEGNYLSLDKSPWKDAATLMDELWFVDVGFDVARKRLVARHVKAGLAQDEEAAGKRADDNDLVNGKEIVDHRLEVHETIVSNQDDRWGSSTQELPN